MQRYGDVREGSKYWELHVVPHVCMRKQEVKAVIGKGLTQENFPEFKDMSSMRV